MGVLANLSLKFHPSVPPSRTLSVLQAAGWQLAEGKIWYSHSDKVEDMEPDLEAPLDEWERVSTLLDAKVQGGETVSVRYTYLGTGPDVVFHFHQEAGEIQETWTSLYEPRPRLCGPFTDFGWYLPKIVGPLYEAHYNILEVTCHDDAY